MQYDQFSQFEDGSPYPRGFAGLMWGATGRKGALEEKRHVPMDRWEGAIRKR